MKNDVVEAVAVPSTETDVLSVVPLPVGYGIDDSNGMNLGIQFVGSPPQINFVSPKSPLDGRVSVGQYCHGIALPGVDIVHLQQPAQLRDLIQQNQNCPKRELFLSHSPLFIDPYVSLSNDRNVGINSVTKTRSVLYKHQLPTGPLNDIAFAGFPPVVTDIAPSSTLHGRLHRNQTVQALLVPGQDAYDLHSGGFTSVNLARRLADTGHIQGRQLVLKDGVIGIRNKGKNKAFDCTIL